MKNCGPVSAIIVFDHDPSSSKMKLLQRIFAFVYGLFTGATVCLFMLLLSFPIMKSGGLFFGNFLAILAARILFYTLPVWIGCFVAGFLGRKENVKRQSLPGVLAICLLAILGMLFVLSEEAMPIGWASVTLLGCIVFGTAGLYFAAPKTYTIDSLRLVNAPIERVFETIGSIEEFSRAVPQITNYEILSEQKQGLGTKFRETRIMNGKESETVLAIIDFVKNRLVRYLSVAGGTTWDTVFKVEESGKQTSLAMKMDATPNNIPAVFIVPLILGMVSKAVEGDMDSINDYCEKL